MIILPHALQALTVLSTKTARSVLRESSIMPTALMLVSVRSALLELSLMKEQVTAFLVKLALSNLPLTATPALCALLELTPPLEPVDAQLAHLTPMLQLQDPTHALIALTATIPQLTLSAAPSVPLVLLGATINVKTVFQERTTPIQDGCASYAQLESIPTNMVEWTVLCAPLVPSLPLDPLLAPYVLLEPINPTPDRLPARTAKRVNTHQPLELPNARHAKLERNGMARSAISAIWVCSTLALEVDATSAPSDLIQVVEVL